MSDDDMPLHRHDHDAGEKRMGFILGLAIFVFCIVVVWLIAEHGQ